MPLYIVFGIFIAILSSCAHKTEKIQPESLENTAQDCFEIENSNCVDTFDSNYSDPYAILHASKGTTYPLFKDEARLLDIPFPINAGPLLNLGLDEEDQRKIVITFSINQDSEDILAFYRSQMECLGWYETALVKGYQTCVLFQKPSRICVITINHFDKSALSEVVLFVAPNKFLV